MSDLLVALGVAYGSTLPVSGQSACQYRVCAVSAWSGNPFLGMIVALPTRLIGYRVSVWGGGYIVD